MYITVFWTAVVEQLRSSVTSLTARVSSLEKCCSQSSPCAVTQPAAAASSAVTKKEPEADEDDEDDDFELFGSDDEVVNYRTLSYYESNLFVKTSCFVVLIT